MLPMRKWISLCTRTVPKMIKNPDMCGSVLYGACRMRDFFWNERRELENIRADLDYIRGCRDTLIEVYNTAERDFHRERKEKIEAMRIAVRAHDDANVFAFSIARQTGMTITKRNDLIVSETIEKYRNELKKEDNE